MGFPLVTLRLVIDTRPEGVPDRFSRPLPKRLSEACGALEAPGDPAFLAAAFGDRRDAGVLLARGGGGITFALLAKGDKEAGSEDGAGPWEGLEEGKGRMALGALGDSGVKILDGVQGDTELADEGLDEQGMGSDDALIGGQGRGGLDSADTRVDDVRRAYMVVAEEGLQGGAACALCGFEGRPATEKVTKDKGVFLLKPVQHVRQRVLQRTGEAVGEPPWVAAHAATMCDELGEGAHRGALRLERLQLIAMGEQECEWEFSVSGVIFGPAGGEGFAVPGQRNRIDGKEDQKVIRAQGGDKGTFVARKADGNGVAVAPRAQRAAPRVDGLGRVFEHEGLAFLSASGLEADIMFDIGPGDTNKGSECFV